MASAEVSYGYFQSSVCGIEHTAKERFWESLETDDGACQQNGMCLCQVTVMSAGLPGRLGCAVSGRVFCYNVQEELSFVSAAGSKTSYCWLPVSFCFSASCGSHSSEQVWSNTLELHDKKGVASWCFSLRIYSQSVSLFVFLFR